MDERGELLLRYVRELHDPIDDVLWHSWDPIGVNKASEARDEYEPYVFPVAHLLVRSARALDVAKYLYSVEHDRMGLTARTEHDLMPVARELCALVDEQGVPRPF